MKNIRELVNGDELICYMRLGLALMTMFKPRDNTSYRQVPKKPRRARSGDLTRFTGVVLANNVAEEVITIMTTRLDSTKIAYNSKREPAQSVDIHYSAFKKVQLLSKYHTEPFESYGGRPTKREGLGTQRKAFRTLEEIDIT